MPKCPVCDLELPEPLPIFCPHPGCGWDLKNDLTLIITIGQIPREVIEEYQHRLAIAKRNYKDRCEVIRKQKELEREVARLRQQAEDFKKDRESGTDIRNSSINEEGGLLNEERINLFNFMDEWEQKGFKYQTAETIATLLKSSLPPIQYHLDFLEKEGYLEKVFLVGKHSYGLTSLGHTFLLNKDLPNAELVNEERINLLNFMDEWEQKGFKYQTAETIATLLKSSLPPIQYHLDFLENKGYINKMYSGENPSYGLNEQGRTFLSNMDISG